LVLASYPMPRRGHAALTTQAWHIVIRDDTQALRDPNVETTRKEMRLTSIRVGRAARRQPNKMRARHRHCLGNKGVATVASGILPPAFHLPNHHLAV
jgi:hypothetical protein